MKVFERREPKLLLRITKKCFACGCKFESVGKAGCAKKSQRRDLSWCNHNKPWQICSWMCEESKVFPATSAERCHADSETAIHLPARVKGIQSYPYAEDHSQVSWGKSHWRGDKKTGRLQKVSWSRWGARLLFWSVWREVLALESPHHHATTLACAAT